VRIAVIFDNFGPYHLARLRAAAGVCELTAVEVAASSAEYAWKRSGEDAEILNTESRNEFQDSDFKHVTLFQQSTSREIPRRELVRKMNEVLDACCPQAVLIPGWSSRAAFAALCWCAQRGVPAIAMSESTEWDEVRTGWKEWTKRKLVGLCAAALAGGTPHKNYLIKLEMPAERIFLGYDVVDNGYFAQGAKEVRSQKDEVRKKYRLPESYFLSSSRFIAKKNLPRLLQAYALYRKKAKIGNQKTEIWNLVVLGDGLLHEALNSQLSTLNLHGCVLLPGFKQYPELPAYYGLGSAFIHASTTEQWGLVVNEAMASGLPVLVSNRCGCAVDLIKDGVNGFTFDPYNVEQLAGLMLKISAFNFPLSTFGAASTDIIADWGVERFAQGVKSAVECALQAGPVKPTLLQRLLFKALLWK